MLYKYYWNINNEVLIISKEEENEVISYNNCFNLDSGTFNTNVLNCFELKTKTLYRLKNDRIEKQKVNIGKVSEKKKNFFRIIKDILDI